MDMGDIIGWEGLNHTKIEEALASFDNVDTRDSELIMPILAPVSYTHLRAHET